MGEDEYEGERSLGIVWINGLSIWSEVLINVTTKG